MSPEEIKKHLAALQAKMKQPMGPEGGPTPIIVSPSTLEAVKAKKKTVVHLPEKEIGPTPEQVIAAAGPPPFEVVAEYPPQHEAVAPCFSGCFKSLIANLGWNFIGSEAGKGMLTDVLGAVPTCPVGK